MEKTAVCGSAFSLYDEASLAEGARRLGAAVAEGMRGA